MWRPSSSSSSGAHRHIPVPAQAWPPSAHTLGPILSQAVTPCQARLHRLCPSLRSGKEHGCRFLVTPGLPAPLTFQPLLSVAVRLAVLVCHWTRRTRKEGRAHVNSSATDPRLPGQLRQHASRILLDLMCYQTSLTLGKVAPLSDYSRRPKPSTAAGPGRPLPESGDTQVQLSQSLHH